MRRPFCIRNAFPRNPTNSPILVDVAAVVGPQALIFRQHSSDKDGKVFMQKLLEVITDASKSLRASGRAPKAVDVFNPQPVQGARNYLLHDVLYDWPREKCLQTLSHIETAMRKDISRLLIVENMIALAKADAFSTALGITFMSMVRARSLATCKEATSLMWP